MFKFSHAKAPPQVSDDELLHDEIDDFHARRDTVRFGQHTAASKASHAHDLEDDVIPVMDIKPKRFEEDEGEDESASDSDKQSGSDDDKVPSCDPPAATTRLIACTGA